MEVMAGTRQEPIVAKKIFLHRNGLKDLQPKMLVVNERQIRDFSSFLNRVTSGIKAPVAVRSIYTPQGGSRVLRLEDLQNGKHYVAGGNEHFKKMRYDRYTLNLHKRIPKHGHLKMTIPVKTTIQVTSRFRNLPEKPYLIHVFRNGDALFKGVRVLIPRRLMNSWEHVLELVTDKAELTLPAKRLCTLDGQVIHAVTDIKDGEKYVALEGARRFIKLPYTSIDPTPKATTNRLRTRRLTSTMASTDTSVVQQSTLTEDQPKIKRLMPIKQHKGVERPFAGHKNKAARNRALRYAQTDSAFGTDVQKPPLNTSIMSEDSTGTDRDNSLNQTHNLSLTTATTTVGTTGTTGTVSTTGTIGTTGTVSTTGTIGTTGTVDSDTIISSKLTETTKLESEPRDEEDTLLSTDDGGAHQEETSSPSKQQEKDVQEPTEVVEEIPVDDEEEPKMKLAESNNSGGIAELQGQNVNETVDLSVARKESQQTPLPAAVSTVSSTAASSQHNLHSSKPPTQPPSKVPSVTNTPSNKSRTSLAVKSKQSSKNVSRAPSKNSTRAPSKNSTRSTKQVQDPPQVPPTNSQSEQAPPTNSQSEQAPPKESTYEEIEEAVLPADNNDNDDT